VASLGEGGQATVWKAIDPLEGGAVRAIKIFQLGSASPENAERARREAKAIGRSRHPGILPCLSLFENPAEDLLGLVFEYVRGRSLSDSLFDPRMTQEHRRTALRQLADTLAYVHGLRVIHRDIKPDNVLVTDAFWESPAEAGTLKLVDFGIAAAAGNPKPLTRVGGVVGTAPYLPPELVDTTGLFEAGDDFQRDVFAFGVLAWEVLIGGHPTGMPLGASRDAFAGVYLTARAGKRVWPPEAPPSPELPIVRACLALSPSARPGSCVVVADALRTGVLDLGRPRTSEPVALDQRSSRSSGTELHVAPRTGPPSDTRRAPSPTSPRYAAYPPGDAAYQPVGIPPPPRAPPPRKMPWALLLGAALLSTAVVTFTVYFMTKQPSSEAPPSVSAPSTSVTPAPSRAPTVELPTLPGPVVACCNNDSNACLSGRACRPAPCEPMGDGPWRLRVVGGFLRNGSQTTEIQRTWQSSSICLRNTRTGEEQCASSYAMWTRGSDSKNRLLATTSDLVDGNIDVRVVDGGIERSRERTFGSPVGYKSTALCMKVILHLRQYKPDEGQIAVFLDDP